MFLVPFIIILYDSELNLIIGLNCHLPLQKKTLKFAKMKKLSDSKLKINKPGSGNHLKKSVKVGFIEELGIVFEAETPNSNTSDGNQSRNALEDNISPPIAPNNDNQSDSALSENDDGDESDTTVLHIDTAYQAEVPNSPIKDSKQNDLPSKRNLRSSMQGLDNIPSTSKQKTKRGADPIEVISNPKRLKSRGSERTFEIEIRPGQYKPKTSINEFRTDGTQTKRHEPWNSTDLELFCSNILK